MTNETANALLVNADGAAKQQVNHPIVVRAHAEHAAMRWLRPPLFLRISILRELTRSRAHSQDRSRCRAR